MEFFHIRGPFSRTNPNLNHENSIQVTESMQSENIVEHWRKKVAHHGLNVAIKVKRSSQVCQLQTTEVNMQMSVSPSVKPP